MGACIETLGKIACEAGFLFLFFPSRNCTNYKYSFPTIMCACIGKKDKMGWEAEKTNIVQYTLGACTEKWDKMGWEGEVPILFNGTLLVDERSDYRR